MQLPLAEREEYTYHAGIFYRMRNPTLTATKQLIRVGHSPDPDDAFMFYALANDQLDTGDYEFTHELVDIETLNRRAFAADLELTAVSIHAYAYLHDKYVLCTCGASMGDGYGPMVVAQKPMATDELRGCRIAVPGKLTSAYLALRLYLQSDFECLEVPFDQIIPAVVAGEYDGQPIDAGLIIHEGQLTYGEQQLQANGGRIEPACRCRWGQTSCGRISARKQPAKYSDC
jgi:1,4-dihydroxy-6-naphthoate synthase